MQGLKWILPALLVLGIGFLMGKATQGPLIPAPAYELHTVGDGATAYKMNRATGEVWLLVGNREVPMRMQPDL
ncbi:MAG: hypothetical protein AB1921_14310 [Thermodesulfobacteriota bacterium]